MESNNYYLTITRESEFEVVKNFAAHLAIAWNCYTSWRSLQEHEPKVSGRWDQSIFIRRLSLIFQFPWKEEDPTIQPRISSAEGKKPVGKRSLITVEVSLNSTGRKPHQLSNHLSFSHKVPIVSSTSNFVGQASLRFNREASEWFVDFRPTRLLRVKMNGPLNWTHHLSLRASLCDKWPNIGRTRPHPNLSPRHPTGFGHKSQTWTQTLDWQRNRPFSLSTGECVRWGRKKEKRELMGLLSRRKDQWWQMWLSQVFLDLLSTFPI